MANLEIEVETYLDLLDPELVKDINHYVTTGDLRRPEKDSALDNTDTLLMPDDLPIAKHDDSFDVLNPGVLEGLHNRATYGLDEEVELFEFVSFAIEHICQGQAFANGNKRTSFLTGYLIILVYQVSQEFEQLNLPLIDEDFVELIAKVAIQEKDKDKTDIRSFLSDLEERISQKQDQ